MRSLPALPAAFAGLGLAFLLMVPPAFAAGPDRRPLVEDPGYLDLDSLKIFDDEDLEVEVTLSQPVMGIVAATLGGEDEDLGRLLRSLREIKVRIYSLDGIRTSGGTAKVTARLRSLAGNLEERGWDPVVKVRDGESQIYLFLRTVDETIAGLTVMFFDPEDNAGFINIVGAVDPAQLARIGQRLDLDLPEGFGLGDTGP